MNATYIGSLPCGELLDPATGITYPFTRGQPITVPDSLILPATDWRVTSAPNPLIKPSSNPKPATRT